VTNAPGGVKFQAAPSGKAALRAAQKKQPQKMTLKRKHNHFTGPA